MITTFTDQFLNEFMEQGFVVVEHVFDLKKDLQPVIDDYTTRLDDYARQLYDAGKLTSRYEEIPFGQRFIRIIAESREPWSQFFDISLPQSNITGDTPIHLSEAVFRLINTPRLLDWVEQFIGPEILSNPVQHVRIKPPQNVIPPELRRGLAAQTDWHQDQGVALPEADESDVLTVWLPVTDATEENGCLCVIPGSHRADLNTHCPGGIDGGLHIPEKLLNGTPVAVPMRRGSVLLMHRRTKHASLPNVSSDIRWSFDLRYQPVDQPTGRPAFPAFIARSRANPGRELHDYEQWVAAWREARSSLARGEMPRFNRWDGSAPVCA